MTQDIQIVRRSFQAKRKPDEAELARWKAESGKTLPEDYRRFLLEWNGGTVRPYGFRHEHPDREPGEWAVLELLLDWDEVAESSQLDVEPEMRTTPPDHLVIGICSLDIAVVLSLEPESHGAVRTWLKETSEPWGRSGNDRLGSVAASFRDFLECLRQGSGTDLYHGFWCRPETAPKSWDTLGL